MVKNAQAINGTVGAFLVLTWLAVVLRAYIRAFMLRKLQLADYFIVLTQIVGTCEAVFIFVGVHGGIGHANYTYTPQTVARALRNQLIIELFFCVASILLRVSIGLQLWPLIQLQDSPGSHRRHHFYQRLVVMGVVSIMVAYGIAWFLTLLFQCVPVNLFWTRVEGATGGHCLSNDAEAGLAYTQAALSAASDLILGLLPIWILWSVNMPLRLKITVACLLGTGISAGVVAFVRLVYTQRLIFGSNNIFGNPVSIILCSFLELSLGVLATCIATFRPLFIRMMGQSATKYGTRTQESRTHEPLKLETLQTSPMDNVGNNRTHANV